MPDHSERKYGLIYGVNKFASRLMALAVDLHERGDTLENRNRFLERVSDNALQLLSDCGYSIESGEGNTIILVKPEFERK